MIVIILVLVAFLILVYVYHYINGKKRRNNTVNIVESFRHNYTERIYDRKRQAEIVNPVARNNNSVDYIEKNDYLQKEVTIR